MPRRKNYLARAIFAALGVVACSCLLLGVLQHYESKRASESNVIEWQQHAAQGGADERHFGYKPNREAAEEFIRSLPKPTIRDAGPDLFRHGADNRPLLLYRALYEAYSNYSGGKQWRVGAQGIGDCVSWGWAHGADIHLAVMWCLGDTSEWRPAATEAIYGGSRVEARGVSFGGWSDGSYGSAAAKWVRDWGILFRQPYSELGFDLSTYSASRAKDWGAYGAGGKDDGGKADEQAKKHPIREVALVTSFEEAARAIEAGYPVPVCSGQGFASTRDEQGFAAPRGSWSHCMVFIGVRYDRPGLLCLNSWGPSWIGGPKWPEDQPDGSFWVDKATVDRMLAGRDSFAVSGYKGFPFRDLKHGEWVEVRPAHIRDRWKHLARGVESNETWYALAP